MDKSENETNWIKIWNINVTLESIHVQKPSFGI